MVTTVGVVGYNVAKEKVDEKVEEKKEEAKAKASQFLEGNQNKIKLSLT